MNNESGSVLQKASFVLLVFIAAALAYLIVRDRIRAGQKRAEAERIAAVAPPAAPQTAPRPFNPSEVKSSFAPLRPRVETNAARLPANGILAVRPSNSPSSVRTVEEGATIATAPLPVNAFDKPVPVATTSGRDGSETGGFTIAGRVTLHGTPPPEKPITLDPMCARLNPAPITTRHFVVGDSGGLANVFVYIKAGAAPSKAEPTAVPLLDNINCQFEPYVFGVRAGRPFQIRNSDPMLHNAHSLPKKSGNREFNLGLPVNGMTLQKVFDKPEVFIQIKCEVHPWMFAYIGVVDHPWFAVTDSKGDFTLPSGLPPGRYTVAAAHLKAGEAVQQIRIGDGTSPTIHFTLEVPETLAKTNRP